MTAIINWMGGWPKDGLVSSAEWEERLATAAERRDSAEAGGRANASAREALASGLLRAEAEGAADRIAVFAGADGALSTLANEALSPGDVVVTERLLSRSVLQLFRKAGLRTAAIGGDAEGPDPGELERAIAAHRPRILYASPTCGDPEGRMWSASRLRDVVDRCRAAGVAFIRDDRQRLLAYDKAQASGLEPAATPGVLSVGQLPPGAIAGLRFGWAAAASAEELNRWFPRAREPANALTPFEQRALADWMREGAVEPLLELLRAQCRERMKRLTQRLAEQGGTRLSWTPPMGGIHLWVRLPHGLDGEALLRGAWLKGLIFQPGAPFHAMEPADRHTIRLTFAFTDDRQLKLGVARLTEAVGEFMGRSG